MAYTKKKLTSEKEEGSIEGDGIKLSVGKVFNHSNRFQTTTSFIYSSIVFDTLKGSKTELDSYGFGFSQRFTYAFKTKNLTLKPYLDFILGQDKFTYKRPSGRIVHSIYNKLGSSIGLKFENQDGLSTFLEYNRAVLSEEESDGMMDRGYTIGLSYLF